MPANQPLNKGPNRAFGKDISNLIQKNPINNQQEQKKVKLIKYYQLNRIIINFLKECWQITFREHVQINESIVQSSKQTR